MNTELASIRCVPLAIVLSLVVGTSPVLAQDATKGWTTVELRAAVHGLSDGFSSWNEQEARVERRASVRSGVAGTASRLWRFGEQDERYAVDGSLALGRRLTIGGEGEGSPTHHIAARVGARGWMHVALGKGWAIQLAGTERRYGNGVLPRLRAGSASLERYMGAWFASYAYTAGRAVENTPTASHQGRLTRFFGARSSITASFSSGTEAENLGWRGIQVMDVKSGALWGDVPLGPVVSLVYGGAWTRQGALYTRSTMSLGVRLRAE